MPRRISAPITLTVVNGLQPGDIVHDSKLTGFGARRQKGAVSYFVKLRHNGQQRWITIGQHGRATPDGLTWTPDTARRQALKLMGNPSLAEKKIAPTAAPTRPTFADVADTFLAIHGAKHKPRTQEEQARIVRLYLKPAFGTLDIAAIARTQVEAAHVKWGKTTPRAANHALAVLSTLMNWAEQHNYRPEGTNPCRRIDHFVQNNRERFLQPDELARLGAALDQAETDHMAGPYAVAAIRLLIYSGARRSEILTLQWSHVDFGRRALLLPDSKTGQKTIHLNDPSIDVLKAIPKVDKNPFVIVGHRHGTHMVNLQTPWHRIRKLAGISDVRLHDLRHTFASISVAAGGSLPIIGRALGHARAETTARYTHLTDDPVRSLAQATGSLLANAMKPKPA